MKIIIALIILLLVYLLVKFVKRRHKIKSFVRRREAENREAELTNKALYDDALSQNSEKLVQIMEGELFSELDKWLDKEVIKAFEYQSGDGNPFIISNGDNSKIVITNQAVEHGSVTDDFDCMFHCSKFDFNEYGFNHLSDGEIQLLGMCLVKSGKYVVRLMKKDSYGVYKKCNESVFTQLYLNYSYWLDTRDEIFNNKRKEYEEKQRSLKGIM